MRTTELGRKAKVFTSLISLLYIQGKRTMPSSNKSSLALIMTLQMCGVATAFAQHDNYQLKLDEFAKSPDPELTDGLFYLTKSSP